MDERSDEKPSETNSRRLRMGVLGGAIGRLLPGHADAACESSEAAKGLEKASSQATSSGNEASALLRRVLPDIYFVNTPEARSRRHLALLETMAPGEPVLVGFHDAQGLPLTECTVCAFDESTPGLLSKLCGTITSLNLSIHTAFTYTLRLTPAQSSANGQCSLAPVSDEQAGQIVVLNTFLVSESYFRHDRALTGKAQRRLKCELGRVLSGQDEVPRLLARSRRPFAPLHIQELRVENHPHEAQTRILLRASNSFGVLYRATAALAALGINITAAQVSTREEGADDLFFVTFDNAKLRDTELARVQAELRARLQSEG